MKRFISVLLLGCFTISVAFGALKKSQIKNKPMQPSSNPSSIQSVDSFENSNAFIGNSYQNAYEQR